MIRSVELLIDRRLMFCDTNNLDGTYANAKKIKDTYFGYSSSPPSVWFIVLYPNFYNQIYYSYYIQLLFFVNYKRTREVKSRNHIQGENISIVNVTIISFSDVECQCNINSTKVPPEYAINFVILYSCL